LNIIDFFENNLPVKGTKEKEIINGEEIIKNKKLNLNDKNNQIEIETILDFYKYYLVEPNECKKIFVKYDFLLWLQNIKYKHIKIYEKFKSDENLNRGIDNFFVFNKIKENAKIYLLEENMQIKINPFVKEDYKGEFLLIKDGEGYICEEIVTNVPWIHISKKIINTNDFKLQNELKIEFTIDKNILQKKSEYGEINILGQIQKINIQVVTLNFLEVELKYFNETSKNIIYLKNNTKNSLNIEIKTLDDFVKFEKEIYTIEEEKEEVPFDIILSSFQLAQKNLKRKHTFSSKIKIKSNYGDYKFFKDISIEVGDFN